MSCDSAAASASSFKKSHFDVVIVGAGPAGLAAAQHLRTHGLSVCILESRARVGGRAYTSSALGVPIDLGASWMHHYHEEHPFYQLAKQKGVGLGGGAELHKFVELTGVARLSRPPAGGFRLFDQDGTIVDHHTLQRVRTVHQQLMNYAEQVGNSLKIASGELSSDNTGTMIDQHARVLDSDHDDLEIDDPWTNNTRHNDISVEGALATERARLTATWTPRDQRILSYFLSGEEQYEAANFSDMSVKHWCSGDGDVECDMFVQTGYGALVADLATGLDIKLETRVIKIQYQPNHVQITTQHSDNIPTATNPPSTNTATATAATKFSATKTYTSSYVIVTVPLGVLKKRLIEFHPPLPAWKTGVIDRMGWGLMNKVVMQFPTPFWGSLASIGHASSSHGLYRWFLSLHEPLNASLPQHESRNNILICFMTAKHAWNAEETKTDQQLVDECMTVLRRMFETRKSNGTHDDHKHVDTNIKNGTIDDTIRGTELEEPSSDPHTRYDSIPHPTAYLVTRWGSDPHALGSYSYFSTQSHPNDCLLLAKHIDHTVYFAGEATHKHTIGCVDSAYHAGLLQASRIVNHAHAHVTRSS